MPHLKSQKYKYQILLHLYIMNDEYILTYIFLLYSIKYMFKLSNIRGLCTPAKTYLFVNVFILILLLIQNGSASSDMLCLGNYECYVENKWVSLISNGIYIAFWTFVFNLMCRQGYTKFAWFLFFLPFILVTIYLFLLKGLSRSGIMVEGLDTIEEGLANTNQNNRKIRERRKKEQERKKREEAERKKREQENKK